MGGKKRPTISQLEKRWRRELESRSRKGETEDKRFKLKLTEEGKVSQVSLDRIAKEVIKWPYVTPYQLASRFGMKISTARRVLRTLESRGALKFVDGNRRVLIYVPER